MLFRINLFPEGKVFQNGEIGLCKKGMIFCIIRHTNRFTGVGRLIYECRPTPRVFTIFHTGMEQILPEGTRIPQVNKKVSMCVTAE
jgi:hypothetical protein